MSSRMRGRGQEILFVLFALGGLLGWQVALLGSMVAGAFETWASNHDPTAPGMVGPSRNVDLNSVALLLKGVEAGGVFFAIQIGLMLASGIAIPQVRGVVAGVLAVAIPWILDLIGAQGHRPHLSARPTGEMALRVAGAGVGNGGGIGW